MEFLTEQFGIYLIFSVAISFQIISILYREYPVIIDIWLTPSGLDYGTLDSRTTGPRAMRSVLIALPLTLLIFFIIISRYPFDKNLFINSLVVGVPLAFMYHRILAFVLRKSFAGPNFVAEFIIELIRIFPLILLGALVSIISSVFISSAGFQFGILSFFIISAIVYAFWRARIRIRRFA